MKRVVAILLALMVLSVSVSFADREIDLSAIKDKDGFYYSDKTTNKWTYYVYASGTGMKGETAAIVLSSWGENSALTSQPEMRFFVTNEKGEYQTPQKVIVTIGSNFFEIKLRALSIDDLNGGYIELVKNDESIIKSLATCKDFKVLFQCGEFSIQASFSGNDLIAVRDYAIDMLRYDFTKVDKTGLFDDINFSSITAYIFEEIDINTILGSADLTDEEWKKITASAIGVTMFFHQIMMFLQEK